MASTTMSEPGQSCERADEEEVGAEEGERERRWVEWMEQQFERIAGGPDELINVDQFKSALHVKDPFFAERIFALLDPKKQGFICKKTLVEGLRKVALGDSNDKLTFLFDIYDVQGTGYIDMAEMREVLKSCLYESSLQISDQDLDDLTEALFTEADKEKTGRIYLDQFLDEFRHHPEAVGSLSISVAQWLSPPKTNVSRRKATRWRPTLPSRTYLVNHQRLIFFFLVFFSINLLLFMVNTLRYNIDHWSVALARGCGLCLNFNCALTIVLMLRYVLTWLRETPVYDYLPIDEHVDIHRYVGVVIALQSALHTMFHFINQANPESTLHFWEYLFTLRSGIGLIPGFAHMSGLILLFILSIMVLCSISAVRRSGHFEIFMWSHLLYIPFNILLILHSPHFGYFLAAPGLLHICEKIYASKAVHLARHGRVYIRQVTLLPSKVTHLVITRPDNFFYQPGDYVFINIPALASNEWHPFTLSSSPDMADDLWLHVRSAGNWTKKLYHYFDTYSEVEHFGVGARESGTRPSTAMGRTKSVMPCSYHMNATKHVQVKVYLDGPYGTPTRKIMAAEHVVLIASGIGVTPYASILQTLVYNHMAGQVVCPECDARWYLNTSNHNMKKVDFIWINRNQRSFEWFISLLTQLEALESECFGFDDFLDMQMYMTSAASKNDMKGISLQMALELLHEKRGQDLITGLKRRTKPGRPNWAEVFNKIDSEKRGNVEVYFCGAPALAKVIRSHCERHNFKFLKEHF